MKPILKLDLHSRKVCFLIETQTCCGEIVSELSRFLIKIRKDSIFSSPTLVEYEFFDSDDDGRMCVLLDDVMKDICSGRYLFDIYLDKCILVKSVKFLWGAKPVVTDIKVERSSQGDCYGETCDGEFKQSPIPEACCEEEKCVEDPCDPCNKCSCDPCGCNKDELHDPFELLERDC